MPLASYRRAVLVVCTAIWTTTAAGQIQQMPPTTLSPALDPPPATDPGPWLGPPPMQFQGPAQDPLSVRPPGTMLLGTPPPASGIAPAEPSPPADPDLRDVRNGVFQKLMCYGTWISPDHAQGMGMTDLEAKCVLAVPAPTRDWPMLITPDIAAHWLAAPHGIELPSQVDDVDIEFHWLPKITERLLLSIAVTPGIYRQFDRDTGPGWRTTVDGAAVWTWTQTTKIVLGASYRDRSDENFIPIGGLLWHPNADFKADLLFPAPKVQHRVYWFGEYGEDVEDWAYVAGEYGDWVWAIQRDNGTQDTLSYRDCRLLLGLEHKVFGGLDWHAEIGYVFARRVRSASGLSDYDPTSAVLLRIGVTY